MTPDELRAEAARRYFNHPIFHAFAELTVQLATHDGGQLTPEERDRAVMVASLALVISEQTPATLGLVLRVPWVKATCLDCEPVLPQPFRDSGERDTWAVAHREATGHRVETT